MLNVKRFKGKDDISSMVEGEGTQTTAIDRKIIRQ